jgi:diaminopimelate decarboxylase
MTHHIPDTDLAGHIQAALATTPSRLPDSDLLTFVERHFANGRRILETISRSVSPCYLFEKDMIAERANAFRKAFESRLPDTGFYFAMKSNNCPDVSRAVLQTGFGLDVSSGVELAVALDLGADDIVFSGPGKTEAELSLAMAHSDRVVILVDSFTELGRLSRLAERRKRTMSIGVRLTNDPRGLWRKFGIPCEQLKAFIDQCQTLPFIDFSGLQFHSSWNMGPERQIDFIRDLGLLIDTLTDAQRGMIRFIDIGGGYWPEDGEWMQPAATVPGQVRQVLGLSDADRGHYLNPSTPIERFAEILSEAITRHLLSRTASRICFEPGRFICHDAMHLFLTVLDRKYDDLVITDAGTNMVGWERFEVDYFPVLNLTRPALSEKPCMILGSLCTPHDVWGYSYWGEDIREGDILMIPTQGAYTFSLRQHFIKPVPDVIIYP